MIYKAPAIECYVAQLDVQGEFFLIKLFLQLLALYVCYQSKMIHFKKVADEGHIKIFVFCAKVQIGKYANSCQLIRHSKTKQIGKNSSKKDALFKVQ